MRIERLDLLAYGPFRGLTLDLAAPGLHIVFGRNEAGKSTTLRAITGLLYGIDTRTRDAHVHKPGDLRIGGVLLGDGGERARLVRRKGNTNTLLDESGATIDEAVLLRLLRGVSEETFRHAFGLDHETLRGGAEGLIAGRGELGESLFDASVGGGGDVQRLLRALAEEADAIYRPRATALPLNDALRAFADAQRQIKETQRLPEAFVAQERGLEDAKRDRAAEGKRRAELVAKKARMDRARRRVPLERRRAKLVTERVELGEIAKHVERTSALQTRLVAYERASDQRRDLALEAEQLRDRVAEAARRAGVVLGVGEDEALRVDGRKESRIQRLVLERTTLLERIEAGRVEIARAERELARCRDAATPKTPAPDIAALARAVAQARALGDAEARHATETARIARRRTEIETRAATLGLFEGPLEALVALRLPALTTLEKLAARVADADRALAQKMERIADLDAEANAIERQISEQSGDFAPPEAAELQAARAVRSEAWARVRAADAKARVAAETAFERTMAAVDELADRMIREADRVTTLARLRASRAAIDKPRADAAVERDRAAEARAALDVEHTALFAGLAPLGFDEMRAWVGRHGQIVESYERLRETEGDAADAADKIASATNALASALGEAATSLAELVDVASRRIAQVEAAARAAEDAARAAIKLEVQIDERAAAIAKDDALLADTRDRLVPLLAPLGVPDDASSDEVGRALEALRDLFALVDKRAEVDARAAAAARDARSFEDDVAALVAELAPDLAPEKPLAAATALVHRSQRALAVAQDLATIEAQLEELGDEPLDDDLDSDAATRAMEEIDVELADLERDLSRLDQNIGGIQTGLEKMRADTGAAEASALAQEALARVRTNAERYCRAKLAAVLLGREIERYREANQGPMLGRASQLFAQLTLGGFSGVRAGFDDKDKPALRCVRDGGAEVDVTALSEGTRDQLYLSLRLASLERHAEIGGAMPLVLDDVLVQFDDERSRAALVVLAEVAAKMQVLFFTHHARLVDLAREALPAASLVVHELASDRSAVAASPAPP